MKQKRWISLLLTFCLIVFALPLKAFAVENLIYKVGENGFLSLNRYTGALERATNLSGDLVIPSSIEGVAVTSIADSAFSEFEHLTSVKIPSSVKSIGDQAFWACTRLISVEIPEGVTHLGKNAFQYCYSLKDIKLPSSLPSIESYTFFSCIALKSIVIPSGVVGIGSYAFSKCEALTSVSLPKGVTSIGEYAFSECTSLSSIALPQGLGAINTALFNGCSALSSVSVPSTVKSIGKAAFGQCVSLEKMTLPEGVEKLYDWAFDRCRNLSEISMPDSINSIAADSFYGCDQLTFRVNAASYAQVFASANNIPFVLGTHTDPVVDSPFTDITTNWARDNIVWAYTNGYFNGTSATTFSPSGPITRAMFVTVIWRMEGEPSGGELKFSDVGSDAYYARAVAWAAQNGIVDGTGNNKFSPKRNINRQEFATMLYRYANYKQRDTSSKGDLSKFTDAEKVSGFARDSMVWAVGAGIISGKNGNNLVPRGNATRAEAATMLRRFLGE